MSIRSGLRILCISLATTFPATAVSAQSAEVQLAFKRGAAALHEGRNADAEREFRNAVRLAPTLPEAYLDLGLVLGREGKTSEAIKMLNKAVELDPKIESGHMFLGIFQYQAGQSDAAIDALHQELALNPKSREALSWLGIVELAAGRPERAAGPLDSAVELAPDDLSLLEYQGRAHSQIAQNSYARMAHLDPDAWQVHKVRAELYCADNRDRDAITEYKLALARADRNPDLYEGLGDAYRRLNELESAQSAYTRELELSPQNPIALYNLGSTYIDRGDYAAGVPLLRTMLSVYRGSPTAEYYLGRGLSESGQNDEAARLLEESAKADPQGEIGKRSYYELARIYRKLQRTEDAQRTLAAYIQIREKDEKLKADKLEDWRKINRPRAVVEPLASPPLRDAKPQR
jgi:tetratricopeptide (TPR) repeat protein